MKYFMDSFDISLTPKVEDTYNDFVEFLGREITEQAAKEDAQGFFIESNGEKCLMSKPIFLIRDPELAQELSKRWELEIPFTSKNNKILHSFQKGDVITIVLNGRFFSIVFDNK